MKTSAVSTRRRALFVAASLALAALAIVLLACTADTTPSVVRRLFGLWRTRHAFLAGALFIAAGGFLAAAVARQALLAFLAIGGSAAGTFALLEAAGSLGVVSWPALLSQRTSELGEQRVPHLDLAGVSGHDTVTGWGLASDPIPFRYRTDRHGFRNDIDRANADIYLIGDSVLVAGLVPFPQTVTARLEAAIRRPVMQIALIGKGPQEVQQLFREARLDVRNRLVIQFITEENDLLDSRRFRQPKPDGRPDPPGERTLAYQLLLKLQRLTQPVSGVAALRSCTIGDQMYAFRWTREGFAGLDDEVAEIGNALLNFSKEIRRAGGDFAIVLAPSKLRVLGPLCRFPPGSELSDYTSLLGPLRDGLSAWSERNEIALLDLSAPLLNAARANRIPWFWGDSHWNAEGHAIAAERLETWEPLLKFHRRISD